MGFDSLVPLINVFLGVAGFLGLVKVFNYAISSEPSPASKE